jgi:hypothetical protein
LSPFKDKYEANHKKEGENSKDNGGGMINVWESLIENGELLTVFEQESDRIKALLWEA